MFFYGSSGVFRCSISYLMLMEFTPQKNQALIGTMVHVSSGFFTSLVILYFDYISNYWKPWYIFLLVCVASIVGLMFLIPESPKWLIGQKKFDEARVVLAKIAKWNGVNVEKAMNIKFE